MSAMWVLLVLAVAPADLQGGELLVLENCNSVVEGVTDGDIGHLAIVIRRDDGVFVAEATPSKVRTLAWDDYLAELARIQQRRQHDNQMRVWMLIPKQSYSADELAAIDQHIDQQVGRRYSVLGYLSGERAEGIHCAQFTAECLQSTGRLERGDWHRSSPSSLVKTLQSTHSDLTKIELPAYQSSSSWCQESWLRVREIAAWWQWSLGEVAMMFRSGPRPMLGGAW